MRPSQSQFGPVASEYLASGVHSNEGALRRLVEVVQPAGGTVLDVGTGAGHAAFALAPHVGLVVASDITREMLEIVRDRSLETGARNVVPCFALAEALPFGHEAFEGLVCRIAAHHFDDPRAFVSEARRVLRPGGWLLVVDNVGIDDPAADDALNALEKARDPSHTRNWLESDWREWVECAGFSIERVERTPKPLNVGNWLKRMRVPEDVATELVETIRSSDGWLRDYLRPHGEDGVLTIHLHEILLFARSRE